MKTEENGYEVGRTFTHRTHGQIGEVDLVIMNNGDWMLDGKKLPDASVRHLLNFSLQSLQDAYAGAKTPDECQGAFMKKRDALINGTIGARNSGVTDEHKVMRKLARVVFKRDNDQDDWKAFVATSTAEQNAVLDDVIAEQQDKFEKAAQAHIKAELAAQKARAKALEGLDIDI